MASFGSLKSAIFNSEERKQQYQAHILGLNAYDRHKKFVKDYGRKASISASEHRVDDGDDDTDNFEEYLEGMFPSRRRCVISGVQCHCREKGFNLSLPVEGRHIWCSVLEKEMRSVSLQSLLNRELDKVVEEHDIMK